MLYVSAVLRLVHIISAFLWFGLGATFMFFVAPAAQKAGQSGLHFFKVFLNNTAYSRVFPASAGLTVLIGLLLYATGSSSHFDQTGNIVLGIGAIVGLLAAGHGGAATGRTSTELAKALAANVPDGDAPIPPEALGIIGPLAEKVGRLSRVSFYLTLVALIAMASARYL